ncbi:hypothetical protein Pmani_009985 [Petrolisthes manimaculis]|uniref:Uncharacterized protein n=1 Tax=Petrolisthes manimaculis TaxID=1843537 RepID=A0AAE1Q316_9EUCA|nr:hypothetical protein Pmani_009985 [Petrolisthes manimaculis]
MTIGRGKGEFNRARKVKARVGQPEDMPRDSRAQCLFVMVEVGRYISRGQSSSAVRVTECLPWRSPVLSWPCEKL